MKVDIRVDDDDSGISTWKRLHLRLNKSDTYVTFIIHILEKKTDFEHEIIQFLVDCFEIDRKKMSQLL